MSTMEDLKLELIDTLVKIDKCNLKLAGHISQLEKIAHDISRIMSNSHHTACQKTINTLSGSVTKLAKAKTDINNSILLIKSWFSVSFSVSSVNSYYVANIHNEKTDLNSRILSCKSGEYYYETGNNNSRHAFGQLQYKEKENRKRDYVAQQVAGDNRRRNDDDGGHLIGSRFGGSYTADNLFPQNRHLNRASYKALENHWCQLLEEGNRVYVDIYTSATSDGMREDSIYGSYIVIGHDGSSYTEAFSFANENKETQEQWEEEINKYDVN